MSASAIPPKSRYLVRMRAHQRCERCGSPAPNGQWHHRRSRRVVDSHQHCPCNGVWLCSTCHRDVHGGKPGTQARKKGWIVSQWCRRPGEIPVETVWGIRLHDCAGNYVFSPTED